MSITKIEDKMKSNGQETRIALLEQSLTNMSHTLIRIEKKIEDVDKKMDIGFERIDKKIDIGFDRIDKKIDIIHGRIWQLFLWGIGAFAGVLLIIAHGFEWI